MILLHDLKAIIEGNSQLLSGLPPVCYRHRPLLLNIAVCKVNELENGIVIREHSLCLGDFTHLVMVSFNGVRGVYNTSAVCRILEVMSKVIPLVTP